MNLARNGSLRVLEVAASSIVGGEPGLLAHMVSTITSSAFSEVVVSHKGDDVRGIDPMGGTYCPAFCSITEADMVEEASHHHWRFESLREMHNVRGFRLVFHVDV